MHVHVQNDKNNYLSLLLYVYLINFCLFAVFLNYPFCFFIIINLSYCRTLKLF